MYLPAISVGYAVPDGNFDAEVHSAFQSALNLRLPGENYLLTLVVSGEGDLPQGIRLDTPKDFSFAEFQVGELAICSDGILRFEKSSLAIQLSGARHWKCDLAEAGRTASPTYLSAWNFIWEALNKRQRRLGAEIVAEELFNGSAREDMSARAGRAMRDLLQAARGFAINPSAAQALIGLGSGLTPSGDDLLIGYLAGLWCTTGDKSKRAQFTTDLGRAVVQFSSGTNDISRTYLYHAAQGQVSSRLANLAEAICRGEALDRLDEIGEAAMSVGHTSGMDAVTGLLIGLATWMSLGASYF